jgi:hypothetical protein
MAAINVGSKRVDSAYSTRLRTWAVSVQDHHGSSSEIIKFLIAHGADPLKAKSVATLVEANYQRGVTQAVAVETLRYLSMLDPEGRTPFALNAHLRDVDEMDSLLHFIQLVFGNEAKLLAQRRSGIYRIKIAE